jgi:hypothetical protein
MATYAQEQAENLLKYYQGMSGTARQPSALSSREEQRAFQAQEVRAGRAPAETLPEDYGGRPQGESRRSIRMQEAYDARQAQLLEQERARQAMDIQRKQMEINNAQETRAAAVFQSGLDEARAQAKVDTETEIQRARFDSGFAELDPRAPEFLDQLGALRKESPLVFVIPEVKGLVDQYIGINEVYREQNEEVKAEAEARKKAEVQGRVAIAKDLAASGLSIADYSKDGVVDFEAANTALGEKLREREQGREGEMDEREQNRALRRQKASAETELVKIKSQVGRFEKLRPTGDNVRELEAARVSQGIFEDEINRINNELGGETPAEPEATEGPTTPSVEITPEPAMDLPEGKDVIQVALDGVGGATLDSRGLGLSDRAINVRDTLLNDPTSQEAVSAIRMSGLKTADDLLAAINYVESVNIENSEKNPLEIKSKEDFERIPSGMMFIAPDGTRRRKQ